MQGPRHPSHSCSSISLPEIGRAVEAGPSGSKKTSSGPDQREKKKSGLGIRRREAPRLDRVRKVLRRHLKFLGPGIVASIAYIDPGNYATDLQAGAQYGYAPLFVVLFSGGLAVFLQVLACRLGCVSGKDLAQHCRLAFYDRPNRTLLWRWGVLYPLYLIAESGIILTDLAELLGSAIALNLLIPAIPLWGGVLLSTADAFLVLLFFNGYGSGATTGLMRCFELLLAVLVLVVFVSFTILLVKIGPRWADVFHGYLPTDGVVAHGALYVAVGIVGATVMPHAMFLGSRIATMDRLGSRDESDALRSASSDDASEGQSASPSSSSSLVLRSAEWCRLHIAHASFDIGVSLLTIAITINSAILILAAAAFYYTTDGSDAPNGDLQSAFALLEDRMGRSMAYLFAISLLMSGQAASITVTLAGQCVSEGFLNWRTSPFVRRLVTRLIGIVPSVIVAVSVGQKGVNELLVASQVALSLVLPFVIGPLLVFTTSATIMSADTASPSPVDRKTVAPKSRLRGLVGRAFSRPDRPGKVSFANSPAVAAFGASVWVLVVVANVYALVELGMDPDAA